MKTNKNLKNKIFAAMAASSIALTSFATVLPTCAEGNEPPIAAPAMEVVQEGAAQQNTTTVMEIVQEVGTPSWVSRIGNSVNDMFSSARTTLGNAATSARTSVGNAVTYVGNSLGGAFTSARGSVANLWKSKSDKKAEESKPKKASRISEVAASAKKAISSAYNAVSDKVRYLYNKTVGPAAIIYKLPNKNGIVRVEQEDGTLIKEYKVDITPKQNRSDEAK